jgi:hypothetical protein
MKTRLLMDEHDRDAIALLIAAAEGDQEAIGVILAAYGDDPARLGFLLHCVIHVALVGFGEAERLACGLGSIAEVPDGYVPEMLRAMLAATP